MIIRDENSFKPDMCKAMIDWIADIFEAMIETLYLADKDELFNVNYSFIVENFIRHCYLDGYMPDWKEQLNDRKF